MPKDEFFEQKENKQDFSFQVQPSLEVADHALHENQMMNRRVGEENYSEESLISENEQIMMRLKDQTLLSEISDDMREKLTDRDKTRLTRNNASLLYIDKKDSDDSGLMGQIKNELKDLDRILRIPMKNGPEGVYRKYEDVIGLLENYVSTKHPFSSEGKRRKNKAMEVKKNLTEELARFRSSMENVGQVEGEQQENLIPMDVLEHKRSNQNATDEANEMVDVRKLQILSLKHSSGSKDGKEMKAVKDEFRILAGLLSGNVEGDPAAFSEKARELKAAYNRLIERCNTYIENHNPSSAEGKSRLRTIQDLMERSKLESSYIHTVSKSMMAEKPEGLTWKEVFGQVTIMAEECVIAKKRTDVLLGEKPSARQVLNVFQSMTALSESNLSRYSMLQQEVIPGWLEKHFDKNMAEAMITERFLIMDELSKKYKNIVNNPVPKEYLKNPKDNPMDEKIREDYARLVMTTDPAFKQMKMLNSLGTTLVMGVTKENSLFKNENEDAGEYYQSRSQERLALMSDEDRAYANEIGKISAKISDSKYKNLNPDAVKDFTKSVNKQEYHQAKKNLKTVLQLKKEEWENEYENPKQEMADIQATMHVVQGKAFVPVQRPENRVGTWNKVKNRLMLGYRWTVGATVGTIASIVMNTYHGAKKLWNEGSQMKKAQATRRHDMVPGRKGEFFEDEVVAKDKYGEDTEVYSDVRRGPLIWEKLSAGDPDAPPEVTIMMHQTVRGTNADLESGDTHAFMGLSYSRYNKTTKRKERYQLSIGFYQGSGISKSAILAMTGGAHIAGQVRSDDGNVYDVARRYQVKPGDINKFLRAAEKYADKGYGMYKRNCSTFVVDMAKTINLPIAKEFKEKELVMKGKDGMIAETGMAGSKAGYYWGANAISSRMNKMDLSYQNFGQKMFTKEDLKRYYKTAGTAPIIKKGYSPNAIGETARNSKSGGDLTARYEEHVKLSSVNLRNTLIAEGPLLWEEISKVLPKGVRTPTDMEMQNILITLEDGGLLTVLSKKNTSPEAARQTHKKISTAMKKLNAYYRDVLGSDARLNLPVMKMLSLYETTLGLVDLAYQHIIYMDAKGDAGALRHFFINGSYNVSFENLEDNDELEVITKMSPGQYEGYLMMGKTPEQAVKEHRRFIYLSGKRDRASDKEKAELGKLHRNAQLANDFANANRYLLEKNEFNEKDLNYAFSKLPAMEKQVREGTRLGGVLLSKRSPSMIYQAVVLEQVFGGFGDMKLHEIEDLYELRAKLDDYMEQRLRAKSQLTSSILKAYIKDTNGESEGLAMRFIDLIGNVCVEPAYDGVWDFSAFNAKSFSDFFFGDTKVKKLLTEEINKIKNGGGVQ